MVAPQAVPHLRAAAAVAGRLSSRLLPAAPRGRAGRAGRGRSSGSAAAHVARAGAIIGQAHRAAHAAAARDLHVPVRSGPALLGRHARCHGTAGAAPRVLPLGVIEAVAFSEQRGRRRAADPLAGPGPAARCGVLPDVDRDGRRHGRVAPEGLRLRGGDAPPPGAHRALAGAAGVRSPRRLLRHAILGRVDRGAGRCPRCVGVAGVLCVQARGLSQRALVAVRAARRGVAVPARSVGAALACCCSRSRGWSATRRTRRRCRPMPISTTRRGRSRRRRRRRRTSSTCATRRMLFNDSRTALHHVRRQGRTWVALGDPVGPEAELAGLVRAFLERCDDFGGVPVFYEVGKGRLHQYADFGLTFVKLGEEAKVDLTLSLSRGATRRGIARRSGGWRRTAARSAIVEAADVQRVLSQLRAVSDDWLAGEGRRREGLLAGVLRRAYLARFPVGVIERDGRIVAFANIWPGPGRQRGLGRSDAIPPRRPEGSDGGAVRAPDDLGHATVATLVRAGHGAALGLRGFARGLALEPARRVRLRARRAVYNFQGLRAYKEKFDPVWEPRYLAYPGGFACPASWPTSPRSSPAATGTSSGNDRDSRLRATRYGGQAGLGGSGLGRAGGCQRQRWPIQAASCL